MKILKTDLECYPEPIYPLGFKGGKLDELWQVKVHLITDTGFEAFGYGVQSTLWADSKVFKSFGQKRSNELMLDITRFALSYIEGRYIELPTEIINNILPEVTTYAKTVCEEPDLRMTFVLNALTPVDWALWSLYRDTIKQPVFRDLTSGVTKYLTEHQPCLGNIPLLSYTTSDVEIRSLAETGMALFKIKIGSDPNHNNDPEEMLNWDIARVAHIHSILTHYETVDTCCGFPAYYLDANQRYDNVERIMRLLDAIDKIDALDRVLLLEEPFPEDRLCQVESIPLFIAADESAHSAEDVVRLVDYFGYSAIALKPIAKTLSITLNIIEEAGKRGVPCFCADLTVNPKMVEMNKLVAAHLPKIPGMKIGVFESNGSQNYIHWKEMMEASHYAYKSFSRMNGGKFILNDDYYACDGTIWDN